MSCLYILALYHLFTLCLLCVFRVGSLCFTVLLSLNHQHKRVECCVCVCLFVYLLISVSFSHSSSFSIALIHCSYLSATSRLPGSSFRKLCHDTQIQHRMHLVNTQLHSGSSGCTLWCHKGLQTKSQPWPSVFRLAPVILPSFRPSSTVFTGTVLHTDCFKDEAKKCFLIWTQKPVGQLW